MFERVGFGIDLAPVQAEHARQEELDEPMPADHAPGLRDAVLVSCAPGRRRR